MVYWIPGREGWLEIAQTRQFKAYSPSWGIARAVGRPLWCHSHGFKSHLKHIQLCELKHASAFMWKMRILYKWDNEEKAPNIPSGTWNTFSKWLILHEGFSNCDEKLVPSQLVLFHLPNLITAVSYINFMISAISVNSLKCTWGPSYISYITHSLIMYYLKL